jgi:hypothetical protein
MKRIFQGYVFAGLVLSCLALGDLGWSRVIAQTQGQVVAPTPQGLGTIPGSANAPVGPSTGSSTFPQGYQSPAAPGGPGRPVRASGQGTTVGRIPYPRSASSFPRGNQTQGAGVGASPQAAMAAPQGPQAGGIPYTRSSASFPTATQAAPGSALAGSPQAGGAGVTSPAGSGQGAPSGYGPEMPAVPGAGAPPGQPGAPGAGTGEGTAAGAPGTGAGTAAARSEAGAATGATPPSPSTPIDLGQLDNTDTAPEANIAALGTQPGVAAQTGFTPNMIGDLSPFYSHSAVAPAPPSPLGPHGAALFSPTLRNFKASENQSPRPQDRVFFDFNFYSNVNSTVNTAQRSPINQLNAYIYMWGFEKTFDQGNGSIGLRLPLNSLTATSTNGAVPAPTSTALGNLDIFGKYILKQNLETGSLITAGFQITPSTGTSRFAGAPYIASLNTTYFQPFIAYIWRRDRFFIQGFTGFDFPANNADVSLIYNDIGMGYMVYQNADTSRFITAIAPTFEVHVNSPLNHRNPYNIYDPAASASSCNLTYGLNLMFGGRSMLTAALVTPVSSPKPFDAEFALLFNYYYGRTARRPTQITPPVIQ